MVSLYGACVGDSADWTSLVCFCVLGRDADRNSGYAGLGNSSAIGPHLVEAVVSSFLDALYKA
jgi:hypothetical protein